MRAGRDRRGRAARRAAERARRRADRGQDRVHRARRSAAGLRRIEVASFVNPKRVPQMADAEEVAAGAAAPRRRQLRRAGAEPTGLRARGRRRLRRDRHGRRRERHLQPPQPGRETAESIAAWLEIARGRASGGHPRPGHDLRRVRLPVRRRGAVGARRRHRADASPKREPCRDRARRHDRRRRAGAGDRARRTGARGACRASRCAAISTTRATPGIANAYAAVEAGVDVLDASIGGIGGCPFAPAATGNIPTEDLVYMLHRSGFETGVDPRRSDRDGAVAAGATRRARCRGMLDQGRREFPAHGTTRQI